MTPRCYICAPMRGKPLYNFPDIHAAAETLAEYGYHVDSPAEHDLEVGFDPTLGLEEQGFDLEAAMRWDIKHILKADAVFCLPGWQESAGCKVELTVARAVGVDIFEFGPYGDFDIMDADDLSALLDGYAEDEDDEDEDEEDDEDEPDIGDLLEIVESESYNRGLVDAATGWLRGYGDGFAAAKEIAEETPSDLALEAKFTEGYFVGRDFARETINREIEKAGERCRDKFSIADNHHGRDHTADITVTYHSNV